MNNRILKLASGDFNAPKPKMSLSTDRIDETIRAGLVYEGNFSIESVNGELMEGNVYCDNHGITILTNSFSGLRTTIFYSVDAKKFNPGDYIKGKIYLVCSGDELAIPASFSIMADYPGIGDTVIRSLSEFYDLCREDYEKAAMVFASPLFNNIFAHDEEAIKLIYEGIIRNGGPTGYAMEEFLIACGQKERLDFRVSENERMIRDVSSVVKDYFLLSKDGKGMFEVDIKARGDFIRPEKSVVTDKDFVGNQCEVMYFIEPSKLHSGRNIGVVTVSSPYFSSEVRIEAYLSPEYEAVPENAGVQKSGKRTAAVKKKVSVRNTGKKRERINLSRLILNELTGAERLGDFKERALNLCDNILSENSEDPWYLLIKAHIFVYDGDIEGAKELFALADTRRLGEEPDLMAYSDLVKYLIYPTTKLARELSAELRELSSKYPSDSAILFSRLQLDSELSRNSARKLDVIRDGFMRGSSSPYVYLEACLLFQKEPYLISELSEFEITILSWGARYNLITREIADQVCRFASARPVSSNSLIRLLMHIADKYPSKESIGALCSYLVENQSAGRKYAPYYAKGIEMKVRIPGIYELYLLSEDTRNLSGFTHEIKLYFRYAQNLPNDKAAMLLSQIVKDADENPIMYSQYHPVLDNFCRNMLKDRFVNDDMIGLYEDYFVRNGFDSREAYEFADILYMRKLIFENPASMPKLVAVNSMFSKEEIYLIDGPVVYIPFPYGTNVLLYEDALGRRHSFNDDVVSQDLFAVYKYRQIIAEKCPDHPYVLLNSLKVLDEGGGEISEDDFASVFELLKSGRLRNSAKKDILSALIECIFKDGSENVPRMLLELDTSILDTSQNNDIIELCIKSGLYDEAFNRIKSYGVIFPGAQKLLSLCDYAASERPEDEFTPYLLAYTVDGGYYDDIILKYLIERFEGSVNFLLKLREYAAGFDIDPGVADARLLEYLMYTGIYEAAGDEIFESAVRAGLNDNVKHAYMTVRSKEYIFEDEENVDSVFALMYAKEKVNIFLLNDICKIALLKWLIKRKDSAKPAYILIDELMGYFVRKGMFFGFYNELDSAIKGKYRLQEISVIEHITIPGEGKPVFKYRYENKDSEKDADTEYMSMEMRIMIPGLYSVAVPLFPGESVQYYIESVGADEKDREFSGSGIMTKEAVYYSSGHSRYDLMQNMIAALSLNEEDAFLKAYEENRKYDILTNELFKLK